MRVKECLDQLFSKYTFDDKLYRKLTRNNIEFMTKGDDYKRLFGSRLIGCFYFKYTQYDKNIFYNNLFDLNIENITEAIENISTIDRSFKIARDDINLVCFYVAHRFLSDKSMPKAKQLTYAKEILNYFSYRTLVLISSTYFVYPISEEKAVSLVERLSNRYIIKKLKNWKEYCAYRSQEYLESKHYDLLVDFTNDEDIPNAITDLYNRTKDTLINIYSEFIAMIDKDEIIKSKTTIGSSPEGEEIILDKLNTPDSYTTKLEQLLADRNSFIRNEYIAVTNGIITTVTYTQLYTTLKSMIEYSFKDKHSHTQVSSFLKNVMVNAIEYLHRNDIYLNNRTSVVAAINYIVGNVLYARGDDVNINHIKDEGEKLVKNIYKHVKVNITDRNVKNIRNALYVYIVLLALV